MDRVYTRPLGSIAPGSRSMAQSHGRCGDNFVAACLLNTSWNAVYSDGIVGTSKGSGLSTMVEWTWSLELQGHWRVSFGCRSYSIGRSCWYPIWLLGNVKIARGIPGWYRRWILTVPVRKSSPDEDSLLAEWSAKTETWCTCAQAVFTVCSLSSAQPVSCGVNQAVLGRLVRWNCLRIPSPRGGGTEMKWHRVSSCSQQWLGRDSML